MYDKVPAPKVKQEHKGMIFEFSPEQEAAIRNLRSDDFDQISCRLADNLDGRCIMGVFCETVIDNHWIKRVVFDSDKGFETGYQQTGEKNSYTTCLPHKVKEVFRLHTDTGHVVIAGQITAISFVDNEHKDYGTYSSLAEANDAGVPFNCLADMIEAHPDYFFTGGKHSEKEFSYHY